MVNWNEDPFTEPDPRNTTATIGKIGAGTSADPYFIGDIAEILIYNNFEPSDTIVGNVDRAQNRTLFQGKI